MLILAALLIIYCVKEPNITISLCFNERINGLQSRILPLLKKLRTSAKVLWQSKVTLFELEVLDDIEPQVDFELGLVG